MATKDYDELVRPQKSSPCTNGDDYDDDDDNDEVFTTLKCDIENLLKNYSSNISLLLYKLTVKKVYVHSFKFQKNVPLTECEKKLGFQTIKTKNIPIILNKLRNLVSFIEKIQNTCIKDYDFFGEWITLAKESLVNHKLAVDTIRDMYINAKALLDLYVKPVHHGEGEKREKEGSLFWDDSVLKKSKYDLISNVTVKKEEEEEEETESTDDQRPKITDSIHYDMAKFIIAISVLNHIINDMIESEDEDETFAPQMKDRILLLQSHLSMVLYRLYSNYFGCNRDGRGCMKIPEFLKQ